MSKENLPEKILHLISQNIYLDKEARDRIVKKLETIKPNENTKKSIKQLQSKHNYITYLER